MSLTKYKERRNFLTRQAQEPQAPRGRILVKAYAKNEMIIVDILDNGIGLPKEQRQQLLEPYITTREKGTGLGLAIVRKIVEEHDGALELHDTLAQFDERGAMIRMIFPKITERDAP